MPNIATRPVFDANRTIESERDASLALWDLYLYTQELESYIDYLMETYSGNSTDN